MEDKFWEDILPKKKSCNALHPACCHIPIGLSKYNRAYNNGRSDCLTALKEAEDKGLICKVPSEEILEKFLQEYIHLGSCAFVEGCHENNDLAQAILRLLQEGKVER